METASIRGIPLYDGDAEAEGGIPEPVRALCMRPWFGRTLTVASAGKSFDAQGKLVDEQLRKLLSEFMAGYAEFLRR